MAEFVLKNFFFLSLIPGFTNKYLEVLSVLNPLLYACIFMDYIERGYCKAQSIKPWVQKRFIDDVFVIQTDSEENLEKVLKELNSFHLNIKFTFDKSKIKLNFLDVVAQIKNWRLSTDLNFKSRTGISTFTTILVTRNI